MLKTAKLCLVFALLYTLSNPALSQSRFNYMTVSLEQWSFDNSDPTINSGLDIDYSTFNVSFGQDTPTPLAIEFNAAVGGFEEANIDFSADPETEHLSEVDAKVKINTREIGLSVLYHFEHRNLEGATPYIRLGWKRVYADADYRFEFEGEEFEVDDTDLGDSSDWYYGIGILLPISKKFYLNVEAVADDDGSGIKIGPKFTF